MGSVLERLIALDGEERSDERRVVLRDVTDMFMTAPDRYGRKDMAVFDLLLSRTAKALDAHIRRCAIVLILKNGASENDARSFQKSAGSSNEAFLRRSVTQTSKDIVQFLREHSDLPGGSVPTALDDGHSLQLPSAVPFWMTEFQLKHFRSKIAAGFGQDLALAFQDEIRNQRDSIIVAANTTARSEIAIARRTVKDWSRQDMINDAVLAELLEARAMTEFVFAASALFDVDACTMFRVLNDTSFESLAVLSRSKNVRRSVFAKTLFGFRRRRTDEAAAERLLPLYDLIPQETAERAVRFWRVRVNELNGSLAPGSNDDGSTDLSPISDAATSIGAGSKSQSVN